MISRFCIFSFFFGVLSLSAQQSTLEIDKHLLLGHFDYRTASDFVEVEEEHAVKTTFLNAVVYEAFKAMQKEAAQEGIELKIVSGTRNFEEQKAIWERKWKSLENLSPVERAQSILEFSSMPATSRHHWGTEIDLNNLEDEYFQDGQGKAEYLWLTQNAARFGFFQVYTSQDTGRTGYKEEKWHWSYLPLASVYLTNYNKLIDYSQITGFQGSEHAEEALIIQNFVNGISEELKYPVPLKVLPEKLVLQDSPDGN